METRGREGGREGRTGRKGRKGRTGRTGREGRKGREGRRDRPYKYRGMLAVVVSDSWTVDLYKPSDCFIWQ